MPPPRDRSFFDVFFLFRAQVSHSAELPALRYVQHVTLPEELEVVCDGLSRRGVIMKPGKPFDTYVAQVDAMMAITSESGGMN